MSENALTSAPSVLTLTCTNPAVCVCTCLCCLLLYYTKADQIWAAAKGVCF